MLRKMFLLLMGIIFVISVLSLYTTVTKKAVNADVLSENQNVRIILDCGHGGEDGGAVSENGIVEKDVNLEIGLTLEKLFLQGGFEVQMIRSTDTAIYDSSAKTLREKKVSDIHNRSDICNNSPYNIYISIHQNKFEESKYCGAQVFFSPNNPNSKMLAECIRLSVKGLLQKDNERQCKESTSDIYILNKSRVPAVLVECGFLSNPEEEKLLNTKLYRNRMAYAIYCGFVEYYNTI